MRTSWELSFIKKRLRRLARKLFCVREEIDERISESIWLSIELSDPNSLKIPQINWSHLNSSRNVRKTNVPSRFFRLQFQPYFRVKQATRIESMANTLGAPVPTDRITGNVQWALAWWFEFSPEERARNGKHQQPKTRRTFQRENDYQGNFLENPESPSKQTVPAASMEIYSRLGNSNLTYAT